MMANVISDLQSTRDVIGYCSSQAAKNVASDIEVCHSWRHVVGWSGTKSEVITQWPMYSTWSGSAIQAGSDLRTSESR